jgi:hypothetical protein
VEAWDPEDRPKITSGEAINHRHSTFRVPELAQGLWPVFFNLNAIILADDMGLGKAVEVLAALYLLWKLGT